MNIRKEVSAILGFGIAEGAWDKAFRDLKNEGRITNKHIIQILIALLKREEERENNEQSRSLQS